MKKSLILSLFLAAHTAWSGPLSVSSYETKDGEQIPSVAKLDELTLSKVGSGVRNKKVALVLNFDVYRATLMVSDAAKYARDTSGSAALDSVVGMKGAALSLRFMREVSAADILKSFETALNENSVKDSPALAEFKKAIQNGGDAIKGQNVNLSVNTEKGVLTCEMAKNKVEVKGSQQFFRDIFSIWLGKPADGGLGKLRDALIKG